MAARLSCKAQKVQFDPRQDSWRIVLKWKNARYDHFLKSGRNVFLEKMRKIGRITSNYHCLKYENKR